MWEGMLLWQVMSFSPAQTNAQRHFSFGENGTISHVYARNEEML